MKFEVSGSDEEVEQQQTPSGRSSLSGGDCKHGERQRSWSRMRAPGKGQGNKIDPGKTDITASLSDSLLRRILLRLPASARAPCSLVCQRWLRILDKDRKELRLLDWDFLVSGRLPKRFPDLVYIDLTWACMQHAASENSIGITFCNLTLPLLPHVENPFSLQTAVRSQQLPADALDRGLAVLAKGCKELQRLRIVDVGHVQSGSFTEWEFVSSNQVVARKEEAVFGDVSAEKTLQAYEDLQHQQHNLDLKSGLNKVAEDVEVVASDPELVCKVEVKGAWEARKVDGLNSVVAHEEPVQVCDNVVKVKEEDVEFKITSALHKLEKHEGLGARAVAHAALKRGRPSLAMNTGHLDDESMETPRSRRAKAMKAKKDGVLESAGSELGLLSLARGCPMLQDLEVHQCTDETISSLVHFPNVQILRLVGTVDGLTRCSFTDVGLTILAQNCRRLIRLELIGCEAGYAGISAIGHCCEMLEELTLSSTGFEEGWIAALGHFKYLKNLRLERCKYIDRQPGPAEDLRRLPTLERLQLVCCELRDRGAFGALLTVCASVRDLEIQDCWGLVDDTFALTAMCRKIRLLSLDGCSLITAAGLEEIILVCKDLQRLRVVHCNNIRESELTMAVDGIISSLKEFRWRPDTKSLLLEVPSIGQTGRWFFSKS